LRNLAAGCRTEEAAELLAANPGLDVNAPDMSGTVPTGDTALHIATARLYTDFITFLLAQPGIKVNALNSKHETPLFAACRGHLPPCIRVLLADPRVRPYISSQGVSPLELLTRNDQNDEIKIWIASGREVRLNLSGRSSLVDLATAGGRLYPKFIFTRFQNNPIRTRLEVRRQLGESNELAAESFALVVFTCDGLLQVPESQLEKTPRSERATRFFRILQRLPLELQVLICNRSVGSKKDNIPQANREVAFRRLTQEIMSTEIATGTCSLSLP